MDKSKDHSAFLLPEPGLQRKSRPMQQPRRQTLAIVGWTLIAGLVGSCIVASMPAVATTDELLASAAPLSIEERLSRFAPIHLGVNQTTLPEGDQQAAVKLVAAGQLLNTLYMRQAWSGNEALHQKLQQSGDNKTLLLFELFKGPWDRVAEDEPFVPGVPVRPKGANLYPEDMTREEFDTWVAGLSPEEQARARGFYYVVRRSADGKLFLRSYADEYHDLLAPAAKLLVEAAQTATSPSLSKFLRSRADAFASNDYLPSELDWLQIANDSALEVTCGPYEVYTDALFSSKAAYELYVHARDFASSEMLHKFTETLADVEQQLPIPDEYKNTDLRATPIVVVNQLYASGDTSVPMTAAYNLPNDERAIKQGGSKLVIIKNVQEGKFERTLEPIARTVLDPEQLKYISFDAFFTHVLMHEVAHSNGPHHVVGKPDITVRSRLQELYSTLEEAKADITGLFAAAYLVRKGVISGISMESFYTTYLASAFRSIRFGLNEAHGRGQALQLNFLIDQGGFVYNSETRRFSVDFTRIEAAVAALTRKILMIQGDGDKAVAQAFLDEYGINRNYTAEALSRLTTVPIDVRPIYDILKQ